MFLKFSVFLFLLQTSSKVWSLDLVCDTRQNVHCSSKLTHPNSTAYGLQQSFEGNPEEGYSVSLKVYWKSCPDLDTVGPTWYRLEPIHPTKDLGKFRIAERSKKYWSFLTKNDGVEFFNSDEPLAILDLPRQFTWKYTKELSEQKHCFKLTIQHENSCQQILSPDCQDINSTTFENSTLERSTTPQPNHIEPTQATATALPTLKSREKCQSCENETIHENSLTCGSDTRVYPHVCYLRLRRCLYNHSLQRDKTWKSCNGTPTPATASPTPINRAYRCLYDKTNLGNLFGSNCNCLGLYKPVQCRKKKNGIRCTCYTKHGNERFGKSWDHTCSHYQSNPVQRHCRLS